MCAMPASPPDVGVPLRAAALRAALVRRGSLWRDVRVVAETGSTNQDLLAAAAAGDPEGLVLAAEWQRNGRGRQGRRWESAPGTALTFSVLLRPVSVRPADRGWLPLLAGLAVVTALRRDAAVGARLKWPNDVLAGDAKLAGILAEQAAGAVVVGIGINVTAGRADLPVPGATSLVLERAALTDRERLLTAVLRELERGYRHWLAGGAAGRAELRRAYLSACATVGRPVRVSLPGGRVLAGTARDVDDAGRLVVEGGAGLVAVSAGDITHVR
jgi:biotin-[acetyl-CoA-carboxylase] ligase BirA-like protein